MQQFLGNPAQVQKQFIWPQLHQRHQRCHQTFRKTCQNRQSWNRDQRSVQATGTPEAEEPGSQRAREEAQGNAADGLFLYIGAPFPARGARREAEIGAGGLVVTSLGGFWACGPRSLPEGPKQRRREGRQRGRQKQQSQRARSSRAREPERKPKGVQQTGFSYI